MIRGKKVPRFYVDGFEVWADDGTLPTYVVATCKKDCGLVAALAVKHPVIFQKFRGEDLAHVIARLLNAEVLRLRAFLDW